MTSDLRQPVLVTRRFDPEVITRLRARFAAVVHDDDAPMDREELLIAICGAHGVMLTPADRVDDELLDAAGPAMRVVATLSVGLDHIDMDAVARHGVRVAYTPDVLTRATAELAITSMLALLRRVVEGDRLIRRGDPWRLAPEFLLGRSSQGLRFGCVGYGRIGREACRLAEALGMDVVHCSRIPTGTPGDIGFDELIATSDVVSIHAPLTDTTHHLIDAAVLSRMRPDAIIVNTSRGGLIDEAALVVALQHRVIAGAALDVFEHEPDVHPGLVALANVVLVPHLGSATRITRRAMGMCCADALETVLLGHGNATNFVAVPPG